MRIFIVSKTAWNLPNLVVHQIVCDLIAAAPHQASTDLIVVSDGFETVLPAGATLMSTLEAERLLISCTNAAIVHFGMLIKGAEHFSQYFIDLSTPKQYANGIIDNLFARLTHQKLVKKARAVFSWKDLPALHLPNYEWSNLALAKTKNTGGDNYFMAFIPLSELVRTLKEFSIFKKWQQTNMALLFVCKDPKELAKAERLVKGYKYRNAVYFKLVDEIQLIDIAAAYLTVWGFYHPYFTYLMQCAAGLSVPLLVNSKTNWPIAFTKGGEYFDFTETLGLSNHFKIHYKDEVYKQTIANRGHAWLNQLMGDGLTIKNGIFAQ